MIEPKLFFWIHQVRIKSFLSPRQVTILRLKNPQGSRPHHTRDGTTMSVFTPKYPVLNSIWILLSNINLPTYKSGEPNLLFLLIMVAWRMRDRFVPLSTALAWNDTLTASSRRYMQPLNSKARGTSKNSMSGVGGRKVGYGWSYMERKEKATVLVGWS